MTLEEFTQTTRNENSDMFLFILVFLMEHRPFSVETVKNLENINEIEEMYKIPYILNNL